jgi:hypothetical protein
MPKQLNHEKLRARDRGRAGVPRGDTPEDHRSPVPTTRPIAWHRRLQYRSVQRYGCLQDDPTFYTALHLRCLCPTHRQSHRPSALCPALPRWMTLRLPVR